MSSSGLNYYLSKYSSFNYLSYWNVWLDFKNTGTISNSKSGANALYSGVYNSAFPTQYDYRNISRSGSNLSYVEISPSTGLWSNEFTLAFLNNKNDSNRGVLFNCLETGQLNSENVYKGFCFQKIR